MTSLYRHTSRIEAIKASAPARQQLNCSVHSTTVGRTALWRRPATDEYKDMRESVYSGSSLDAAARNFTQGIKEGRTEDDLIAQQLGYRDASQLEGAQEEYAAKLKEKVKERAREIEEEKAARSAQFEAGKAMYERGRYSESVTLLEEALRSEGELSVLGGEMQLWLALGYQACGKEDQCISVYKNIEKNHPVPLIRRQAADLRYIMEAPKLELGEDEKVKIPVLTDIEKASRTGNPSRPRPPKPSKAKPKTWDEEFWENYTPPMYLKNRYVWAAASIICIGLAWYSAQR